MSLQGGLTGGGGGRGGRFSGSGPLSGNDRFRSLNPVPTEHHGHQVVVQSLCMYDCFFPHFQADPRNCRLFDVTIRVPGISQSHEMLRNFGADGTLISSASCIRWPASTHQKTLASRAAMSLATTAWSHPHPEWLLERGVQLILEILEQMLPYVYNP